MLVSANFKLRIPFVCRYIGSIGIEVDDYSKIDRKIGVVVGEEEA